MDLHEPRRAPTKPMSLDDFHDCPGPDCDRMVPTHILACRRHWLQVKPGTKARVNAARAGTVEYETARTQAISEMRR